MKLKASKQVEIKKNKYKILREECNDNLSKIKLLEQGIEDLGEESQNKEEEWILKEK